MAIIKATNRVGVRVWPLRKKNFFYALENISKKNVTTKLEGGGRGKALFLKRIRHHLLLF